MISEAEGQRGREAEKKRTYARTLLNAWSNITLSLHESLNRIHQNTVPKFISLILTFLFVVQFPLMAMADHTNEPVIPVSDEDFLYYHHDDHLGSSHVLTEGKDKGYHSGVTYNKGDLLQRFEYEPFGREKYVLNPNLNIDPSYTGQTYDVESGLYYYHARYYDPTLARFIQPDTLVPDAKNLQAFNRYSYVVNNPFKYTDPSGHGALDWFRKLLGVFIGAVISAVTFGAMAIATAAAAGIVTSSVSTAVGVLSFTQMALLGALSGAIGGVIGGAISGGGVGALMGFGLGLGGGAVFGGAGHALGTVMSEGMTMAVLGSIGAGLSYATGGWKGLVTFGVGLVGGFVGSKISNRINQYQGGPQPGEEKALIREIENSLDMENAINDLMDKISYLIDFYDRAQELRFSGHRNFPGNSNSAIRHQTTGRLLTREYGARLTRFAGMVNEVQGLIIHDLRPDHFFNSLFGNRPWAFSITDLIHNESGIRQGEREICFQQCLD